MSVLIVLGCVALSLYIARFVIEFVAWASGPLLRFLGWALVILGCIGVAALMSLK